LQIEKKLEPIHNNYNKDLNQLVEQMYSDNPNDRPTASQALTKLIEIENSLQYTVSFNQKNK